MTNACGTVTHDIDIMSISLNERVKKLYEQRNRNMTTPNKNIIVFGSNNFINAVYDNFSIRDFKKSYS